ncbi:MAG TPA: hypothetical protein VIM70_12405 [Clostridium sp.]|uniref:hypothetical protein n=1 Tax=Clostridium sp. TaxID=1506 RepID=UPI002F92904B
MNCALCGAEVKSMLFIKNSPFYNAISQNPEYKTEYKIEQVKDAYWVKGTLQRNVKLPVCYIARIKDQDCEWSNGQGFDTLEQAKQYCNKYEFNN